MVPRLLIDRSAIPGEGGELRLMQRGSEFSIMLGNNELMNSRLSGSEEALATLSCGKILPRPQPQMLIRSEEHTSELQSLMRISYAVFCLKKKNTTNNIKNIL